MEAHVSKKRKRSNSEVSETIIVGEYHAQAHRDSLRSFFEQGEFTDVVVRCCGAVITAHKVILATHSKVLANKFRRWNHSAEAREVVDMDGDDLQVVKTFLDYAYNCTYDATDKADRITKHVLRLIQYHVRVYAFAIKYAIEGLRDVALDRFEAQVATHWDTTAFALAVGEIYNLTHPSEKDIRMVVFRVACEHADVILEKVEFRKAVEAHGEFADFSCAVAKRLHEKTIGPWRTDWYCRSCCTEFEALNEPAFCVACGVEKPHRYPWGTLLPKITAT